jgi:hypothetical protein
MSLKILNKWFILNPLAKTLKIFSSGFFYVDYIAYICYINKHINNANL